MANADDLYVKNLFSPGHTAAWEYLSGYEYPWQALAGIRNFIMELGAALSTSEYERIGDDIWIHCSAGIAPSAHIGNAVIIGPNAEIRHCAFIRGSVLVGENAVIGNSTEVKNSIIFDGVQAPHFTYIGDSILGYKSHMGAGSITSNIKSDKTSISVAVGNERIDTGMRKFGSVLGDYAEIGCNTVLNPGCIIGAHTTIYPLSMVRGLVPSRSIYKKRGEVVKKYDT